MNTDPSNDPHNSAECARALAFLAAPAEECECEVADDGAAFVCAACRARDDDGAEDPAAGGAYAGAAYAAAPLDAGAP